MNINCQSVKSKRDQFQTMLETEMPDVVVGTESWLNKDITTGEIFPPNFQVFRKARTGRDSHGGVFIAVKDNLIANEEPMQPYNRECKYLDQYSCKGHNTDIRGGLLSFTDYRCCLYQATRLCFE